MRHEKFLLTHLESASLIAEVNRWIRRTGTNYNRLITAANVAPSVRSAVKHRKRRLTIQVADRLRRAMRLHPDGIPRGEHKRRVERRGRERLRRQQQRRRITFAAVRVDRTPCSRCGARRDIGCKHWKKIDG